MANASARRSGTPPIDFLSFLPNHCSWSLTADSSAASIPANASKLLPTAALLQAAPSELLPTAVCYASAALLPVAPFELLPTPVYRGSVDLHLPRAPRCSRSAGDSR